MDVPQITNTISDLLSPSKNQKNIIQKAQDTKSAIFDKEIPIHASHVKIMYIVRGLPGSGKSNFCRNLLVHILKFPCSKDPNTGDVILTQKTSIMFRNYILSTDDFFSEFKNGKMEYIYNPKFIKEYNKRNKERAYIQASIGVTPLFIDNVNASVQEILDYIAIGNEFRYLIHIIESPLFHIDPKLKESVKEPQWLFKNRNVNGLSIDVYQRARARYEVWDLFPNWKTSEELSPEKIESKE
jgi:hypothetical protein